MIMICRMEFDQIKKKKIMPVSGNAIAHCSDPAIMGRGWIVTAGRL